MSKHFSLIIIKYTTFTLQLIEYKSLWNNRKYILFTNTTMQIIHTHPAIMHVYQVYTWHVFKLTNQIHIYQEKGCVALLTPQQHRRNVNSNIWPNNKHQSLSFFSQEISNCYYLCSIFFNRYFQLSFPLYRNTNCRNVHFL